MEINRFEDVIGVIAQQMIIEGRMVTLCLNAVGQYDWGSRLDLPGARLPFNHNEALDAHWCITWAQDNRDMPIYQAYPAYIAALRYGFDQPTNVPFAATVYVTQRSVQEGLVIPSGEPCIAFGPDSYLTVQSGAFVYTAPIAVPGCPLEVLNLADDGAALAGQLNAQAVATVETMAMTVQFDPTAWRLTFRIL